MQSFYDAAVSGADPVTTRPGFGDLLAYCESNGVSVVLVENASRFARDLAVQLTGHALLRARGIELIPADAPTYFTDPSPTAEMVRQILGAVSQFEKAGLVAKLKRARDRKRAATGRCEGRKAVPERGSPSRAEVAQDWQAPQPSLHRGRAGRARPSRAIRAALLCRQRPPHAGRLGAGHSLTFRVPIKKAARG